VIVTGTGVNFLSSPFHSIPLIFKTAGQDFLYSGLLTVLFGLLMLLIRRWRTIILWLYGILALISVIIGILNIKITSLLGRPFTYQWLYYSDFLSSTDAKKAISSNFDADTLKSFILLLCITLPMVYFYYHFIRRKKYLLIMMFILFCLMGYLSENDQSIETTKKENPVTYFVLSAIRQNGGSIFSLKKSGVSEEFLHKNKNIIPEQYASAINNKGIKNVIIYVFESLPAEFVTPFNRKYNATPFLDSIKSSAVLFDRIYAHAPATNKSMLSILCGMYPYLSYKLITVQKPDIKWPSVSDELKKSGYETSFFNSGDNRFSGAEDFLQHRGFSDIFDFRTIPCNSSTYSDIRYRNQNLEGVSDSCLSLGFFNWLAKNESKPFFSMMWTYQTHYPYFVSGKTINFNTGNNLLERYLNALHQSDATLKQIVTGLKDRDLLNSTLIVILGDHGEAFGKHGQTGHAGGIYDENLHIPLMFINPGLFHGEYINETGGISDIAPTILSILNKPVPEIWQGENLLSENRRKRVYFFSPYSDILFGFREDQYKFIYNATSNTYYLYDLLADPHESVNIINKKKQYAEESKKHLHEWIQYQLKFVIPFLK
jgi:phosphoglycerol transferase MdoB-like AlkP superfamily enzyme